MAESSGSVVSNNVNAEKQTRSVQSTDSADKTKTDKVMEPILLEDYKYKEDPQSLKNMLQYLEKTDPDATITDILVGMIFILMLESGFVPIEEKDDYEDYTFSYQRLLKLSKKLPDGWKKNGIYSFSYILPPFQQYECRVACLTAADDLTINCVVKGVENGSFTTIIDPLTFFCSPTCSLRSAAFYCLNHLACKVKSDICYPAKQLILQTNNITASCIEQLPQEIILLIVSYLKSVDVMNLGKMHNARFLNIYETIWKKHV